MPKQRIPKIAHTPLFEKMPTTWDATPIMVSPVAATLRTATPTIVTHAIAPTAATSIEPTYPKWLIIEKDVS